MSVVHVTTHYSGDSVCDRSVVGDCAIASAIFSKMWKTDLRIRILSPYVPTVSL